MGMSPLTPIFFPQIPRGDTGHANFGRAFTPADFLPDLARRHDYKTRQSPSLASPLFPHHSIARLLANKAAISQTWTPSVAIAGKPRLPSLSCLHWHLPLFLAHLTDISLSFLVLQRTVLILDRILLPASRSPASNC
jgi:hypothetical protein